jgi:hypothetical protein
MVPQPRRVHLLGQRRLELADPRLDRPYIHLPMHPHLCLIGIWDIDRRLLFDVEGPLATDTLNDAPFFPLVEQLSSLLRQDVSEAAVCEGFEQGERWDGEGRGRRVLRGGC